MKSGGLSTKSWLTSRFISKELCVIEELEVGTFSELIVPMTMYGIDVKIEEP